MNFKVIFHLDGSGVCYDPSEPLHLDALLAWCLAPMQCKNKELGRDDVPEFVALPLINSRINGVKVWHASALFPDGQQGEDLQFWRKRFRQGRADLSTGAPVLTNGTYRDWNAPLSLLLCSRMVAFASGNRGECKKVLKKQLRYLGKKRAYGHGRIVSIEVEETPEDWSLVRDGQAMRWLPDHNGTRLVRSMPPYWNRIDRIRCREVGDLLS
jgi:hypothetical protein